MKKLLMLLLLLPLFSIGQIPAQFPNSYVHDYAGAFSDAQIERLNRRILTIEKATSVQIAIVLVMTLPEDLSIEEFALEIGRKWHIGNAQNGIVYVASFGARKQRLEIASRLQGDIPDIVAKEITDDLKAEFRNHDYERMINVLLDDINKRIDPVAKEQLKLAEAAHKKNQQKTGNEAIFILMAILGSILFVVINILRRKKRNKEADNYNIETFKKEVKDEYPYIRRSNGLRGLNNIRESVSPPIRKVTSDDEEVNKRRPINTFVSPFSPSPITEPYRSSIDDSSSTKSSSDDDRSSYGNYGNDSDNSPTSGYDGGGSTNDL